MYRSAQRNTNLLDWCSSVWWNDFPAVNNDRFEDSMARMLMVRVVPPLHLSASELARRAARYRRLAPVGVHVELTPLRQDARPLHGIESAADVERSEHLVHLAVQAADPASHDVVLPDCVLDPVAWRGGEGITTPVPVLGMLQLTIAALLPTGRRFGAVARTRAIAEELNRLIGRYGSAHRSVGVRVLGLPAEAMADSSAWFHALQDAAEDLAREGARTVINGCSAVDVPEGGSPLIIDPAATALQMLSGVAATLPRQRSSPVCVAAG